MSIDSTVSSSYTDSLRLDTSNSAVYETEEERSELTQEDFFSLLTQQLAYQDPSNPVENAEMISQMTAFQTSEGISELNDQIGGLADIMTSSQALQASTLVGQNVLVAANAGHSSGSGFDGIVALEDHTSNISVTIEDASGQVIQTIYLDDQSAGNAKFEWDGTNLAGEQAADGVYQVTVNGMQNGKSVELPTAVYANVQSVSLSSTLDGTALNLSGLGTISLSDVLEVAEG
ncbi:flagellar hook assembly protein FlgD [Neiella marina]|uniref:Basal-body rod modification protein FlgD n=1 Tax=Neiella holothuriorum TaxID=2870530 RepID=A0ABS7EES9_9GAMM|nr:flagellar hook assembly protein FlgD [Neiella holothuriorum]MBW8190842.1 flagellar hook assembly protein FlgD [Neiella holothuriorum]